MDLSNLRPAEGSKHSDNFRRGRGHGSGNGKTAGKGHKGQLARSGAKKPGFEGGQMPLQRRIPKFGFINPFRKQYVPLNVETVEQFVQAGKLNTTISLDDLRNAGLVGKNDLVKLLGRGEIEQKVEIEVHAFSNSAREKVEKAGGSVTAI